MTWDQVGIRIGTLRRERNLTRAQFGKLVGISGQYVGRIEKGQKLSVELIAAICKAMGVSTDYIILGIADPLNHIDLLKDLSSEQIELGFDILKRLAELINTENGNELLLKEIMRRQYMPV